MTSLEFKKVGRLLKELYKELEANALSSGVDIFSAEYTEMQRRLREALLMKMGFTPEEYIEAKNKTLTEQNNKRQAEIEKIQKNIVDVELELEDTLTAEDVERIAKANIPAPVVTNNTINKIIKETTVEKPIVVEKTVIEKEEYDDGKLWAELGYIRDKVENIAIPEPESTLSEEEVRNIFGELFAQNINVLDMPDWRRLAMGLQAQIDEVRALATTESGPGGASEWGSITGTLSDQTDLQTALNGKADALGADDNYVTDAEKAALHSHSNKTALDNVSGVNTGDEVLKYEFGITVDGAGTALTTGSKGYRYIQEAGTITGWHVISDQTGSIVFDVKRSGVSLAGSEKPTLSSQSSNSDLTLSTWTTSLSAGDIIEFVIDSASTVTRATLTILVTKT